ncbi:chemotaxis protein CheB [Sphingobium limneticum]|jgi:two-component system chemotaxis response regulator CheB|uniref:protein-glutamate methylesterase n=1 Tax=Sphingobium limneticum TaxID=1007511 RepID=A0A5J5ICE3_9SPHN|nr:chemotaxis protein CheB [Sphingobium limneticum]KAA9021154.1 chemotaxis protein CheB [Sphingobium limneticum]KAA9033516.1 chemotaxis protein CheB [Sphingobium limneticum]
MSAEGVEAIAIGASAGAVQALLRILPALPADYPIPLFIVVHVPPDRSNALVSLFAAKCQIAVREAEDKEPILPGTVYFAPSDYHLLVEADRSLSLSMDEPVNHSRPAIDVLLESAADAYGPALAAIVLTGANHDGAAGLKAVCAAGGTAIVQDFADAQVATMPEAALTACPSARVMTLDDLIPYLLTLAAT